jgi:hypothetical protein
MLLRKLLPSTSHDRKTYMEGSPKIMVMNDTTAVPHP